MAYAILPHCALILVMFIWASSFIATKVALTVFTPMEVLSGRMLVAAILFLPLCRMLWRRLRVTKKWGLILVMVLCEPCFYCLFETQALLYTSAAQAGMLACMQPLVLALTACLFLEEKTSGRTWTGLAVACAGVILMSLGGIVSISAPAPLPGNMLEGFAMCFGIVYVLCCRRLSSWYSAIEITAMQTFAGLIFFGMLMWLPPSEQFVALPTAYPEQVPFFCIIYLGVVVSCCGYWLYNYGIRRFPAARTAAYINLMPVISLAMGGLALGEGFNLLQYVASGLVVLGVCLSLRSS